MSTESRTVILTAVDANRSAQQVVAAAAQLASLPGGELHVVHVIEAPVASRLTAQLEEARGVVARATEALPPSARLAIHFAAGDPATQILQVAANIHADMIVIGTREMTTLERFLLGSVVEPVTRKAQCPVYVVRKKDYHTHDIKEIEPPCPECLAVQRKTKGAELWCTRHQQRHVHANVHYELPEGFGVGSSLLQPLQSSSNA
jgi:nucleotide-binding universal stress UspA family protein